jgi:hypothetical protein
MVFGLGLVAFFAAFFLAMTLRREYAFKGALQKVNRPDQPSFDVEVDYKTHKQSYSQRIGIRGAKAVSLRVEDEGTVSRFLKKIGVGRDILCGDPLLDHRLVIESDDPRVARWLKTDPQALEALHRIFALRPQKLVAFQGRLWLLFKGQIAQADQSFDFVTRVALALRALVDRVPSQLVGEHGDNLAKNAKAMLLLALSMATAIAAAVSGLAHVTQHFPQHVTPASLYFGVLPFAIASGLLLLWIAARWMRDSARARVVLLELSTVGLIGFIVLFLIMAGRANVAFASEPAVQEVVELQGVYSRRGRKGGTSYYVRLSEMASGKIPATEFKIGYEDHHRLLNKGTARVEWQLGALGQYVLLTVPEPEPEPEPQQ